MEFGTVALNVAITLAYAIPGFLLIKTKLVKADNISAFAKLLLYVCQPCLSIYSFQKVLYTKQLFIDMVIFFALSVALQIIALFILKLVYLKKSQESKYRIATVAPILGNVGFFGIPLLEALMPENPEAVAYAATFIISLNLISWTLGAFFITGNKSFIHPKKIFLNPPFLTLFITLPLFFTKTSIPDVIMNCVTVLAKFTTPLCMIIIGMRFATANVKEIFCQPTVYVSTVIKLIIFPLFAFLLTHWLPINHCMKATIFILCSCPSATLVLALSEINHSGGEKYATNTILMSTIFCSVTIPLLLLLL